ncbi:MAG: class I SAM-dependent methyltransferase [Caldilineaceae bacterium]|nr:class I SAM-dependent methyltransferase [Caldilineaceae bacterium]
MITQPKQFSTDYSSIFQDDSVVAAYPNRPSYPPETFERLAGLVDRSVSPVRILDVGCGTGQMTSGLLPHAEQIDAVDISAAMIAAGKQMTYGADPRINWIIGGIEEVPLNPPYAVIVAAASLHWTPWAQTLPRFAQVLSGSGYLALVEQQSPPDPWADELRPLFAQYSMNRDFQPYNMGSVADELETHGLFRRVGVWETAPVIFRQPVAGWIEAIHARNGFSRRRMDPVKAAEFDRQVRTVISRHCPDGEVEQQTGVRIIFGKPLNLA